MAERGDTNNDGRCYKGLLSQSGRGVRYRRAIVVIPDVVRRSFRHWQLKAQHRIIGGDVFSQPGFDGVNQL